MDPRDEILQAVADGEITAAEAVLRLDALEQGRGVDETPQAPPRSDERPQEPRRSGDAPRAIRVTATGRAVEVIGDERIREAVAEGPHTAHRQGDVLVVNAEVEDVEGGFGFGRAGGWGPGGWGGGGWGRAAGRHAWPGAPSPWSEVGKLLRQRARPLVVRMSPELALEVELVAGSASVDGVHGEIDANVSAGSLRLEGVRAPVRAAVTGGAVTVAGRLDRGASRIRCEAGAVNVQLDPTSSVRVAARSTLSRVVLPGEDGFDLAEAVAGRDRSTTIGAGTGSLDIEATMGNVRVTLAGVGAGR